MEPTDWAFNAAQINQDIGLANEHLPPDLQVPEYVKTGGSCGCHTLQPLLRLTTAELSIASPACVGFSNRIASVRTQFRGCCIVRHSL